MHVFIKFALQRRKYTYKSCISLCIICIVIVIEVDRLSLSFRAPRRKSINRQAMCICVIMYFKYDNMYISANIIHAFPNVFNSCSYLNMYFRDMYMSCYHWLSTSEKKIYIQVMYITVYNLYCNCIWSGLPFNVLLGIQEKIYNINTVIYITCMYTVCNI